MKKIKRQITYKDIKDREKLEKIITFWLFVAIAIVFVAGIFLLG